MPLNVVLIDQDSQRVMQLAQRLAAMRFQVTVADIGPQQVNAAGRAAAQHPRAIVYGLTTRENILDIRSLLSLSPETKFLFLAPAFPPSAALARVVNAHGSTILSRDEPIIVIASTLIAMLSAAPGNVR
jgi:hypothetical protein